MGTKIFHMKHDFISTVVWEKMLLKFLPSMYIWIMVLCVMTLVQEFILS